MVGHAWRRSEPDMSRYEIGERAEADLNEIWTYIAQHDHQAADRPIDRLFERFEMLGRQPTIGELWGGLLMRAITARY